MILFDLIPFFTTFDLLRRLFVTYLLICFYRCLTNLKYTVASNFYLWILLPCTNYALNIFGPLQILGYRKNPKYYYPITPFKGAPRLRAHALLNGITQHAPLTRRKVEASSPRIRVKKL